MDSTETNGTTKTGLKAIIVGAGIGGLSAAITLRQQNHEVSVFESSRFATELGAAIHIPPNAHGLLKRMGLSPKDTGANPCQMITTLAPSGQRIHHADLKDVGKIWQHEWLLGHRVKLHESLKTTALQLAVRLHLSSPILTVDPDDGTIVLADGSSHKSDVIVGADGVHSITRNFVVPGHPKPFSGGKSAFGFLIPKQAVLDDPQIRSFAENEGELMMAIGQDRRLIMYPMSDNTLLNFVCIHPEEETSSASTGDWSNTATKAMLLSVYKDFHPNFLALLDKANEESPLCNVDV